MKKKTDENEIDVAVREVKAEGRQRRALVRARAARAVLLRCEDGVETKELCKESGANLRDLELLQRHGLARWVRRDRPRFTGDRKGYAMVWFACEGFGRAYFEEVAG